MIRNCIVLMLLLSLCSVQNIQAQYLMTSTEADFINFQPRLGAYTIETCTDSMIAIQSGLQPTGYTFHQNGLLYAYKLGYDLAPFGGMPSSDPDRHDLSRMAVGYDYFAWSPEPPGILNQDSTIQAIATGLDSVIYAAGVGLWSFAPNTGDTDFIGDFPPEWRAEGGMTLREGELYMTTVNNDLLRVDNNNPANSELLHTFPDSISQIESLVTVPFTCDSIVTFAFTPTGGFMDSTIIYILDFEDYSLTPICSHPEALIAVAAMEEIMIPPCELYADLDFDDNTSTGFDFIASASCTSPISITDIDIEVFGQIEIDSFVLEISGISDVGMEYLSGINNGNVQIQQNNNGGITLINTGNASFADFEAVFSSIQYFNDAIMPTYGARTISVTPYALYYQGAPSFAYINLINENLSIDAVTAVACFNETNGSASLSGSGGTSPYAFLWEDGTQDNMRDDLAGGSYPITLTDAIGCYQLDTLIIIENDSLYTNITAVQDSICGNTGILMAAPGGGQAPYTFTWNGTPGNATINNLDTGYYEVIVTDGQSCTTSNNYTLFPADTILTNESLSSCEGTPILWQGQEYLNDTTICIASTSSFGCDSVHCVSLSFQDTFLSQENFMICQGEMLDWQGLSFEQDTSLCLTYTNNNGCDSTYCLSLSVLDRTSNIEASICEGTTYDFNEEQLQNAGIYRDTIVDGGLCDSIIILSLNTYPATSVNISSEGSLCEGENVALSASGSGGYNWSTGENTISISVETSGWYYLTLTDANGCTATDSILLSQEAPNLIFSATNPNCPGFPNGAITIDSVWGGMPPYLYTINGFPLQSGDIFPDLEAGAYTLSIEDVQGCQRQYEIALSDQSTLSFSLGQDLNLRLGDSIQLNPLTNASNYQIQWWPMDYLSCDTCLNPIIRPLSSITYQVAITDDAGCELTDDISIIVEQKEGVYIPNAFSPNGDGRNDQLIIFADNSIRAINVFQVFNRWGSLVFERSNFLPNTSDDLNWDGTINREVAPIDVYTYLLKATLVSGEEVVLSGEINLLR